MLLYEGKLSFCCFLLSCSIVSLSLLETFCKTCSNIVDPERNIWWLIPSYFVLVNIALRFLYKGFSYQVSRFVKMSLKSINFITLHVFFILQVAIRSVFLGTVFAVGISTINHAPGHWRLFGAYLCVMSFFHYSEFLAIAWCNPSTLSVDSFILNHSTEYGIAAVSSWVEFFIEIYLFPGKLCKNL